MVCDERDEELVRTPSLTLCSDHRAVEEGALTRTVAALPRFSTRSTFAISTTLFRITE